MLVPDSELGPLQCGGVQYRVLECSVSTEFELSQKQFVPISSELKLCLLMLVCHYRACMCVK